MANQFWTGRTGQEHDIVSIYGTNFWAGLIGGDWKIFPDGDDSFEFLWGETDADEFVRVRAFNEKDAKEHAESAFQQWSDENQNDGIVLTE